MAKFGDKLKAIRLERELTQDALAELLGTSKQVISRYENNQRSPKVDVVSRYAETLNVPIDFLLDNSASLPSNIIPMPEMYQIPLLGTIACGQPILAQENVEANIDIPTTIKADFALRCKGDSMIGADIYDGDIVYIRRQEEVLDGQIAAVLIEDAAEAEATLKRVYYDREAGELRLVAENPAVKTLVYHGETLNRIKILGKAVGLTRSLADI